MSLRKPARFLASIAEARNVASPDCQRREVAEARLAESKDLIPLAPPITSSTGSAGHVSLKRPKSPSSLAGR